MENKEKCDGKCLDCTVIQRSYCAAQMAYYNQKEIAEIKAMLQKRNEEEPPALIQKEDPSIYNEEA